MLRWGVIGTGFISHEMLKAISRSKGSITTMIAGRNDAALLEMQSLYGIAEASTDIDALLNSDTVDVVYIALPNHLHLATTQAALAAGKAVLCEKSLTTTMADATAMIDAVNSADTFFAEGLMYLAHPFLQQLASLLRDPSVGALRSVSGFYAADIYDVANPAGGGTLFNLGCYPASLLQLVVQTMCGDAAFGARSLSGHGNPNSDGILQDASVSVLFDNGVLANLQSSDSYGMAHEFVIVTTTGTLRIATNPWLPQNGNNRLIWQPFSRRPAREILVDDPEDGFFHQTRMVERALASGAKQAPRPSPRPSDSLEIMKFLTEWQDAATQPK